MTLERLLSSHQARAKHAVPLESLEGFGRMSGEQQQMLRTSLTAQGRDMPDTDCHLAVFYLEQGAKSPGGASRSADLKRFHEVGYGVRKNPTLADLSAQIEQTGFPCIVSVGERHKAGAAPVPLHTFVALGRAAADIDIWEKEGFAGTPHRASLAEVYARYLPSSREIFWSTRILSVAQKPG
jgi:hypothetical protein